MLSAQSNRDRASHVLNNKIAHCLNNSKRLQLSQMKEDFCIMKFLKKQYQGDNFVVLDKEGLEGKQQSAEIPPQKLESLKEEYF